MPPPNPNGTGPYDGYDRWPQPGPQKNEVGEVPNSINMNDQAAQLGQSLSNGWAAIDGGYNAQRPVIGQPGAPGSLDAAGGRARGVNGDLQSQSRDAQMALIQQLQGQANGTGPSLAQMQLQKGTDQNMSQAMALGASQRGAGAGGMLKGIQGQQAAIGQGMTNDAAMLRLQEQMQAQNALGQNLGQMRGQDQGFDQYQQQNQQFNAGLQQNNNQFNSGQTNQMATGNADRAQTAQTAQANIDLELEKLRQQNAKDTSPVGSIGGLLGGMAMSDERVKEEIEPGEDDLYSFLDSLGSHSYEYKDKKHGKGRRISPMAQEIEKTPLGKEFVFETDDGKAVDYGKGLGTMLAATAALHKRMKKAGL